MTWIEGSILAVFIFRYRIIQKDFKTKMKNIFYQIYPTKSGK